MTKLTVDYVAGVIDARGIIGWNSETVYVSVRMKSNLPRLLYRQFGGSYMTYRARKPSARGWWRVNGHRAVAFLQAFLPHLIAQRNRARQTLSVWQGRPHRLQSAQFVRVQRRHRDKKGLAIGGVA